MPGRLLELFSGTGSVGRVFRERGWDVLSLDLDPRSDADLHLDVLDFDFRQYPPGHFQCVWASPPCVQYSIARTTAKEPRDLEGADTVVQRALDIVAWFQSGGARVAWAMENPHTGLLKSRPVVAGLPLHVTDYCAWEKGGTPYRKRTAIWSNLPLRLKTCDRQCAGWTGNGHAATAQRGPGKRQLRLGVEDRCTLDQLHALPAGLVEAIEAAAREYLDA